MDIVLLIVMLGIGIGGVIHSRRGYGCRDVDSCDRPYVVLARRAVLPVWHAIVFVLLWGLPPAGLICARVYTGGYDELVDSAFIAELIVCGVYWLVLRRFRRRVESLDLLVCPQCLYPLVGLAVERPCPECGLQVPEGRLEWIWRAALHGL